MQFVVPAQAGTSHNRHSGESRNPGTLPTGLRPRPGITTWCLPSFPRRREPRQAGLKIPAFAGMTGNCIFPTGLRPRPGITTYHQENHPTSVAPGARQRGDAADFRQSFPLLRTPAAVPPAAGWRRWARRAPTRRGLSGRRPAGRLTSSFMLSREGQDRPCASPALQAEAGRPGPPPKPRPGAPRTGRSCQSPSPWWHRGRRTAGHTAPGGLPRLPAPGVDRGFRLGSGGRRSLRGSRSRGGRNGRCRGSGTAVAVAVGSGSGAEVAVGCGVNCRRRHRRGSRNGRCRQVPWPVAQGAGAAGSVATVAAGATVGGASVGVGLGSSPVQPATRPAASSPSSGINTVRRAGRERKMFIFVVFIMFGTRGRIQDRPRGVYPPRPY